MRRGRRLKRRAMRRRGMWPLWMREGNRLLRWESKARLRRSNRKRDVRMTWLIQRLLAHLHPLIPLSKLVLLGKCIHLTINLLNLCKVGIGARIRLLMHWSSFRGSARTAGAITIHAFGIVGKSVSSNGCRKPTMQLNSEWYIHETGIENTVSAGNAEQEMSYERQEKKEKG